MEWLSTYRNTTPVIRFNDAELTVEDIVFASLVGQINLLLVSERGEGKTQILNDALYGIFGGYGSYIRCTPDMEIKDVFTAINLEQLKKKEGTTESVIETTEAVKYPFTAIDELNRAPPIVQNQLLQILDGYIEVNGKRYNLGIQYDKGKWYHVAIATVNIDLEKYAGTFGIDLALLDRFGIVLDLDYYATSPDDVLALLVDMTSSKLRISEKRDLTRDIIELHKEVLKETVPLEVIIGALYLRDGIDYISREPYSQRKLKSFSEKIHESGALQGLMRPISIRTARQIIQLYKTLNVITKVKGYRADEELYFDNFVSLLPLVLPYSGALNSNKVETLFYGNPMLAVEQVKREIMSAFFFIKPTLVKSFRKLKAGSLTTKDLLVFNNEWSFLRQILEKELSLVKEREKKKAKVKQDVKKGKKQRCSRASRA